MTVVPQEGEKTQHRTLKRCRSTTRIMLLALAGAFIAGIGTISCSIYTYSLRSETASADAAIVLGAAAWGSQPSPVFRERIHHAIALYHDGYVHKIVFTGGQGNPGEPAEAIVARQYALAHRVPACDILIETQSRTTQQNLYGARQITVEHGLTHLLIVSDPLHMKRAITMARDLGMDAYPSPTPTSMYRSLNRRLGFLARETWFYLVYLILGK